MKLIKEEIIKLEHKLIEAIKASDIDFIEKVLHDDLLFLAPNGQIITKEMDLTSHKSKQMIVERLIPNFEDLGQPISGQFRYIRNWKVFNDHIKIVSGACLQIS
jgi:Domain of unknown function (DUF4440)